MGRVSFENYGLWARSGGLSPTVMAGRYQVQAEAEKLILPDVLAKMGLGPADDVIDIGCGSGLLLIPLSGLVHTVTGVDHRDVIDCLQRRFSAPSVTFIGGNFLELNIDRKFSAAIAYGVVNYMCTIDELYAFVDKATDLLAPNGRLLIGDIPNQDRKRRFLSTDAGRLFDERWRKQMAEVRQPALPSGSVDRDLLIYSDKIVIELVLRLRRNGFNAYVLPQPPELPFGWSREDILVTRMPV
jgi:SAM-dependent methyltransferase